MTTEPNQTKPIVARHTVRDGIQTMILVGQRPPGTKLRQQELAKTFGVTQGVVREALLELQALGLVETVDNRGMFVSELNMDTVLESFDVREVHEGLVARLCCERITRAQIRELTAIAEQIYSLGQEEKLDAMGSLDREFHRRLMEIAGNRMLLRMAENYQVLGKVIRANRDPKEVLEDHLRILQAIEAGQADEAERRMRQHVRVGKQMIQAQIARGNFVPQWVK